MGNNDWIDELDSSSFKPSGASYDVPDDDLLYIGLIFVIDEVGGMLYPVAQFKNADIRDIAYKYIHDTSLNFIEQEVKNGVIRLTFDGFRRCITKI